MNCPYHLRHGKRIYKEMIFVWKLVIQFCISTVGVLYIVAVSLLVEETGVPGENHRPAASH
jgi:hypothetical protein